LAARWGEGATWHLSDGDHPHEAATLAIDATKARVRLGWLPRLPLDAALDWTVDWHRAVLQGQDAAAVCTRQIAHYRALPGLA
jgi:CDP-glucose 4,6-dehydratase